LPEGHFSSYAGRLVEIVEHNGKGQENAPGQNKDEEKGNGNRNGNRNNREYGARGGSEKLHMKKIKLW
jgi:hypothetical protein